MNETATGFLARLKQRKLVQWSLAYVAFAFALIQGVDVVAQQFGWPDLCKPDSEKGPDGFVCQ